MNFEGDRPRHMTNVRNGSLVPRHCNGECEFQDDEFARAT